MTRKCPQKVAWKTSKLATAHLGWANESVIGAASKSLGRALLGGALNSGASAAQGGSVRDGFVGAFVSELIAPSMNGVGGKGFEGVALRVVASAVAGGTAAELTGGKFSNGAITAAFIRLFHEEMSMSGQIQASGRSNPLTVVGDVIGKIWALPHTIVGLIYGGIGWALGGDGPTFGNNAIQFKNSPIMGGALTFGNVEVFGRRLGPDVPDYPFDDHTVGFHEGRHTIQAQVLGPLYFPAHILGGLFSIFSNGGLAGDFWHRNNFMENGPLHGRAW